MMKSSLAHVHNKTLFYCFKMKRLILLSTVVLNSGDQQGMYGMQHFCVSRNPPCHRL